MRLDGKTDNLGALPVESGDGRSDRPPESRRAKRLTRAEAASARVISTASALSQHARTIMALFVVVLLAGLALAITYSIVQFGNGEAQLTIKELGIKAALGGLFAFFSSLLWLLVRSFKIIFLLLPAVLVGVIGTSMFVIPELRSTAPNAVLAESPKRALDNDTRSSAEVREAILEYQRAVRLDPRPPRAIPPVFPVSLARQLETESDWRVARPAFVQMVAAADGGNGAAALFLGNFFNPAKPPVPLRNDDTSRIEPNIFKDSELKSAYYYGRATALGLPDEARYYAMGTFVKNSADILAFAAGIRGAALNPLQANEFSVREPLSDSVIRSPNVSTMGSSPSSGAPPPTRFDAQPSTSFDGPSTGFGAAPRSR